MYVLDPIHIEEHNRVMNYFGYPIINPFRSKVPRGFYHPVRGHTGIDIATPSGTPLSLPIPLTVAKVANQTEMGLTMYLRDSEGKVIVFSHLSEVKFQEGQQISAGQVFALTGNSGSRTTGPHLHLEVIAPQPDPGHEVMSRQLFEFGDFNIDPVKYLDSLIRPHWSDEAMDWAMKRGLISYKRHHAEPVTWGELVVVLQRLDRRD